MAESAKVTAKAPEAKRENAGSQSREPERSQSMDSPLDRILFLQRTIGNQAVQRMMKSGALQAKLRIGQPNDIYEQEADRVADQVMRMSEPRVQRQPKEKEEEEPIQPKPLAEQITPLVQRQTEEGEEEEEEPIQTKLTDSPQVQRPEEETEEGEKEPIQTKPASGKAPRIGPNLAAQIHSIRGGGQPLPQSVRNYFEPRFGLDFSQVRVHTGAQAAETVHAVNARVFTLGHNITFGTGQYAPETRGGRQLLAHELTHVVQQRNRPPSKKTEKHQEIENTQAIYSHPELEIIQRSEESDLISEHTSWGNLDEERLGRTLLQRALRGEYQFVQRVIGELGYFNRDDVSFEMVKAASDANLIQFTNEESGRRMLDYLYDNITSGSVSDEETTQANRIMAAKSQLISTEEFGAGAQEAKIFPYRLPGLTVFNDAPIIAERRGEGRIWVRIPVRVAGTDTFREEVRTLPSQVFTSGIELPENEIIGVKMYDLGGEVHYRPALYLIQLANETTTTVFQTMGEAAAIGLTLGSGALLGTGARMAWGARALLWADRAAFVLGTITTIIREHRGWIISRFGDSGRAFLRYIDMVNSAVMIYGGARALMGVGQLLNNLRRSYSNWRSVARSMDNELSASERSAVNQISRETDELLENVDNFQTAQRTGTTAESGTSRTGIGVRQEQGPLAGVTDDEIEAALEGMTSPRVTGPSSRSRIEGRRVPTRQHTRLDIEDIPLLAGETMRNALRRIQRVIGRKLSDIPEINAAWQRAREHVLRTRTLNSVNYEELYNLTRNRFWQEVRNNATTRQYFRDAGFEFPSSSTSAPTLRGVRSDIPVQETRVSLDHIREKAIGDNWRYALDAENLKMTFQNPNTLREITQMRHPELRPSSASLQ